jgi:hypothetical protein
MFRFTIRDLLWLMVVVGLAVGWSFDRRLDAESWKREAAARDSQFNCLLGQFEKAMPQSVHRRDDGHITVTGAGGAQIVYPNSESLRRELSN